MTIDSNYLKAVAGDTFQINKQGDTVTYNKLVENLALLGAKLTSNQLAQGVKSANNQYANLQKAEGYLAQMTSLKTSANTNKSSTKMPAGMKSFLQDHNIKFSNPNGNDTYSSEQWDGVKEGLQGYVDNANNISQLAMVRLNALVNKNNQLMNLASNIESKHNEALSEEIRNLK